MTSYSTLAAEHRYYDVNGQYHLPNDSSEHQRLDAQSQSLIALMNHRPFHPPISNPKKILDVGCGTGAMTTLLASLYPSAQVIGVDISPVPIDPSRTLPGNLEFVQGNINELSESGTDSRFELGTFDFVFQRLLILGVVDWAKQIETLASLLSPGGWLECQEVDMRMYSPDGKEDVSQKWWHTPLLWEDCKANGLQPEIGAKLRDYVAESGRLVNVKDDVFPAPAKGRKDRPELDGMGDNITKIFLVLMDKVSTPRRSPEEVKKMQEDMTAMFRQEGVEDNLYNFHAVVGQKSLE